MPLLRKRSRNLALSENYRVWSELARHHFDERRRARIAGVWSTNNLFQETDAGLTSADTLEFRWASPLFMRTARRAIRKPPGSRTP